MSIYKQATFVLGFLDLLGVSIIIPQLAINFSKKGYSPFLYGLAEATYGGLQTFSGPAFGGFSDVHGRKQCIVLSFGLSGFVYLWLGFIESLVPFFIARALLGLVKHTQTVLKAYLSDITPRDDHATTLGHFNAISSAGFIIGPLIGAHIGSFEGGCIVVGGIFIVSAIGVYLLLPYSVPARTLEQRKASEQESLVALFKSVNWPKYWDVFSGRLLLATAVGLYRSNLNYMLMLMYSLSAKEIGYITSLMGVMAAGSGFLVGPIFNWVNRDSSYVLVICSLLLSVSLAILYVTTCFTYIVMLLVIFQLSASFARAFGLEIVLSRGHRTEVGLLHGMLQSISSVSRGIIPLLSGILQSVQLGLPTIVAAGLALAGSAIFLYTAKVNGRSRRLKED